MTSSNWRRPFWASWRALWSGSEMSSISKALLCLSSSKAMRDSAGFLEFFGFPVDGFPGNSGVFDVGIAVGKTATLLLFLFGRQFHIFRFVQKFVQFFSHFHTSSLRSGLPAQTQSG